MPGEEDEEEGWWLVGLWWHGQDRAPGQPGQAAKQLYYPVFYLENESVI